MSYAAILGYRRSRRNFIGIQARVVTIHDGVLQVVDRAGEVNERHAVTDTRVELKRGMVAVTAGGRSFFLTPRPFAGLSRGESAGREPEGGTPDVRGASPAPTK